MTDARRIRGMGVLATLREGVRVAIDSLRANKVRSGLTILGVAIGVLVVMAMAAVVQGLNDSFGEAISARGATTFYVFHAPVGGGGIQTGLEEEENEFMRNRPLDPAWAEDLARLPGIARATPLADLGQSGFRARAGEEEVTISLYAVNTAYLEIDGGDVVDGRWFTSVEDQRRAAVAVVDSQVAEDLFGGLDPIGRHLVIGRPGQRSSRFEIIGLYRRPPNVFSGLASHWVFVPFSAAMKELDVWERLVAFSVQPAEGVSLDRAIDLVRGRMRQIRGLKPGQDDDFNIITQEEFLELWNDLTGVLFVVMIALSGVGLLVGGVGVIGIMMISVTERTREIGLRKAVGARRRDLLLQFLVEAATLTALGGAIGMALGAGAVALVTGLTPIPASVPLWAIIAALAASILTGVGFGLYPAARGAALDPVDALRYE
ncbi:MAG: ABC transporter permease [Gemmatimonadota bacterium]|nr:ABC transporter permease [Gemmatimonadota bacterium]